MDYVEPGCSGVKVMTRKDIFKAARMSKEKYFAQKLDYVQNDIINRVTFPASGKQEFIRKFSILKFEMKTRWIAAKRTEHGFLKKNHDWLQVTVDIPYKKPDKIGRPVKSFAELCDHSKRRKSQNLKTDNEAEELLYAGQMKLRETGNLDAATVVKDITTTPTRGSKYRKAFKSSVITASKPSLTPTEALSIFVEASLSRKQYEIVRSSDHKKFPCYSVLQKAKNDCYPIREAISVSETRAEVRLQDLLNHTAQRLVLYLKDFLDRLTVEEIASLELICKWGCDGSQQTMYKQIFENSNDSDANMFQSSLVPLQLICSANKRVIWSNPTPSSPRYCRPMRIRFIHETSDVTNEEIEYYNDQIQQLEETKIASSNGIISIKHTMLLTMVDGKVCNAATHTTSTMRCYICKATSKEFNDLSKSQEVNKDNLKFGLSVLHARIRFFESLLHLSYKITIKKWQIRSQADKDIVKERKRDIQEKFRNEIGLIVDVPKAGYGNSNDGNTSRRFFANAQISSQITGIDLKLIKRFDVILQVISSGHKINIEKFSIYCHDTAKLYVELYSWHPMTPTVHKILIHGPLVVQHALLPIGALSEEAAEARNKHFRQYRLNFSRKFSRVQCNTDVLNRLLLTSDVFISSIRPKPQKRTKPFSVQAMEMLMPMEIVEGNDDISDRTEDLEEQSDFSDEEGWDNVI